MNRTEEVPCPVCQSPSVLTWSGITEEGFDTPRREDAAALDCPEGHELSPVELAEHFPRIIHRLPRRD